MTPHTDDPMLARARELALAAMFVALGITVPILFHAVGLGRTFLPMHLPILIGAVVLRPPMAVLVALLTPWASMLLTGMPPLPMAVVMCIELGALSAVVSTARILRVPVWLAVVLGILVRIGVTWGVTTALAGYLHLPPAGVGVASIVAGAPGIVLQLAIAPASALAVLRRRTAGS
jgi:hypothetical protein